MTWTLEQEKAITWRQGNLLVSAAAGAGKTAVLVERVIHAVVNEQPPLDIDQLLIVTFTDAAAGEMRHRLNAALIRALQEQPSNPHLQRQVFLLPRAYISTIHSFCSEVVRRHFYLLGLDPGFRVIQEDEAEMLRREVLLAVIDELYEEHRTSSPTTPFLYLTRALSSRYGDDREVINITLRLYDYAHSLPRPKAWMRWMVDTLSGAASKEWEEQPWLGEWQELIRLSLENAFEKLSAALRLAQEEGGPVKYAPVLRDDIDLVRRLLTHVDGSYEQLRGAMNEVKWPRLPSVRRGECATDLKDRVTGFRNDAKDQIRDLNKNWFNRPASSMLRDFTHAAILMEALVEIAVRFEAAYRKIKSEKAIADFADLEHYALAVLASNAELSPWGDEIPLDPEAGLTPSPVAQEYRAHFAEVLVDEYQDINGIQEAILGLVAPAEGRFMVGDVKQSIYRFRLADPQVFLDRYNHYVDLGAEMDKSRASGSRLSDASGQEGSQAKEPSVELETPAGPDTSPGYCLDLTRNFRSRSQILKTVNYLFSRIMTHRVGELDYDERASLQGGYEYPPPEVGQAGGAVEFHLLEYSPVESETALRGRDDGLGGAGASETEEVIPEMANRSEWEGLELEDLDATRLEARWVTQRIHILVTEENIVVFDRSTGDYRPATWRDVVVLMRSPRGRITVYLEELQRMGIPAYADGSGGYFAAPEVQTMLSLLQLIDNPRRDIALAGVLRSPLVGLNATDLAAIRSAAPEGDFYSAVARAATGDLGLKPETAGRIQGFWNDLRSWRDMARNTPVAEILEEIYRQTGYYDYVGGMPAGMVRQANLRALIDRARQYAGTIYRGLFSFLRYVERMQTEGTDMDTARSLAENEDVVRIMSIHRSKGLEFPIVIVSGLGRQFNLRDLSADFLFHRELGCGATVYDLDLGLVYPTVLHRLTKERLKLENLAEEMRLLYVALTRARERLIVAATARNLEKTATRWQSQAGGLSTGRPLSPAYSSRAVTPLDWFGPVLMGDFEPKKLDGEPKTFVGEDDNWQLHLWPSESLVGLCAVEVKETDPVSIPEIEMALGTVSPCPDEWLSRQEAIWEREGGSLISWEELKARLLWTNPYQVLAELPSKITVTEWRHRLEEMYGREEEEAGILPRGLEQGPTPEQWEESDIYTPPAFELPKFFTGRRLDGTERGRAVHLVMMKLNLTEGPLDEARLRRQIDRLVSQGVILPDEAELVSVYEMARFFASDLGKQVILAAKEGHLRREVPFTIGLPVAELYPELTFRAPQDGRRFSKADAVVSESESILVQGVIDCLVVTQEGLVIVDYKTDRISAEELPDAVARYRVQLDLYARAAGQILQRPVKGKYLYFFALGQASAV